MFLHHADLRLVDDYCVSNARSLQLYNRLRNFLQIYVEDIVVKGRDLVGKEFLAFYFTEWTYYEGSIQQLNGIFNYLNRNFIRREIEERREGIYEVRELTLLMWRGQISQELIYRVFITNFYGTESLKNFNFNFEAKQCFVRFNRHG